jgi:hypothetical protein
LEIEISKHTSDRAKERGAEPEEIIDVILNGVDIEAKYGRYGRYNVYEFNTERLGKFYKQKKIEVYYVMEQQKAIAVTVYVFYGKWN